MIDQDNRYTIRNNCPSKLDNQRFLNITAVSFSSYYFAGVESRVIPFLNGDFFPNLTHLIIADNNIANLSSTLANIIGVERARLQHLEYLDASALGALFTFSCPYDGFQYHPWFLSESIVNKYEDYPPYRPCTNCTGLAVSPRLTTIVAQNNKFFPLDFENENCSFQRNNLSTVDISRSEFAGQLFCSKIRGLEMVKKVIAREMKFCQGCIQFSSLFEIFSNMEELDLDGSTDLRSVQVLYHDHLNILKMNDISSSPSLFPDNTLSFNLDKSFPNLEHLSLTGNSFEHVNISLPSRLLTLNLSNNEISVLPVNMQGVFSEHFQNQPKFKLDLRGNQWRCDCRCNGSNFEFLKWLVDSTFVFYDDRCVKDSNYSSVTDCVSNPIPCSVTDNIGMGVPIYVTIIIGILGFVVVALVILSFFFFRHYQWRIRFWFRDLFRKHAKLADRKSDEIYLSYCTDDGEQADLAFRLWDYARKNNLNIKLKSRYDIKAGEWTNDLVTKYVRQSHKVLLLMPDDQYSRYDNSMYEFQLAIRIHDIHNIHPIIKMGRDGVDDIAIRFPPLVPEALRPYCKAIYPLSSDDDEIGKFFENLMVDLWPENFEIT